MSKLQKITAAAGTLVTVAVMNATCAAPATAETYSECLTRLGYPTRTLTNAEIDACWKAGEADAASKTAATAVPTTTTAPTTYTPSSGSSSSFSHNLQDFIESAFPWVVGIVIVIAVLWVIAKVSSESAEEKKRKEQSRLGRGRRIAQDAGCAPDAMAPADLRRYVEHGWAVPWVPGTAFGNLVTREGGNARILQAWTDAAELARLGHWDEAGVFVPAARVMNVAGYDDRSGDLRLSVSTRDYTTGERELARVLPHLLRTARVATASPWERDAAKDWYATRLSMTPEQQQSAPTPQQEEAPAPDPAAGWEW
ncbi:hypothetical protein PP568_07055 [Mycobacteroides abscessus]|uniref:Uncharacterized protein n=1 Tax=Mycobacteroides abscessus subsp. abscessus TaxID=1185650 RepID=A0AB38D2L4_9MYCO|nr:hypothetical protein [Mycobacteroides abscessus]MBE5419613.1 hypothetical protein [Mycobacteroides abscessus]MBE5455687.1 hypothetical protein [Mycobacteroides abscessus]MBN7459200.1 hypothetical protein [Mycobacteroides abscessus subsp. abscessus]MBN7555295.1 hypothetical protein [Mycobacteroides abscessus subsp. abscessus]MDM2404690.1 hypothetical protein [Mycobacteroides abscessus]